MDLSSIPPGGWWLIGGFLLLAMELMAPGVFLAFVGAAAIATGVFTWAFDLGVTHQIILMIVYTAVAVLIGKRMYAHPAHDESDGMMNDRARQLIGRKVTVKSDFVDGEGRVVLGDSEWNARAAYDAEAGDRMVITKVEGTRLVLEAPKMLPKS
ncbi:NfeD family protein [Sphingomicrobium sediminis]|uniref:NfeD family protein n=1 Tax=Sphingomicrobium sediminis TaxID=2950949 RepID=A0A9X2EFE5_9SPHN|nr:NfeD family protein [Sphingomicrobium sediminis]MCM8556978.1 NfeD family protein [Sphingomicrobium sediminis]